MPGRESRIASRHGADARPHPVRRVRIGGSRKHEWPHHAELSGEWLAVLDSLPWNHLASGAYQTSVGDDRTAQAGVVAITGSMPQDHVLALRVSQHQQTAAVVAAEPIAARNGSTRGREDAERALDRNLLAHQAMCPCEKLLHPHGSRGSGARFGYR
jgi:hypothetical protein